MAIILMKGADQVGNSPATYQAAVVLSNLMVAQLYATRFLVENDQEQVELVLDELSSLQDNLMALDVVLNMQLRKDQAAHLGVLATEYETAFSRSEEHTSELQSLM